MASPTALTRRSAPPSPVSRERGFDLGQIAYRIYLAGVGIFGISLLAGIWRVHRLRNKADVSVSATRLANEMAQAEGMSRGIEVAISSELAVPITFQVGYPVILLPAETNGWSEAELLRAIRHDAWARPSGNSPAPCARGSSRLPNP